MTRRAVLACLLTAVVAGAFGYLLHRRLFPRRPPLEVIRQERSLPRSARLHTDDAGALGLSADGRVLVASVRDGVSTGLLLQYLDKFDATAIPGAAGSSMPFLSHDGASVGFVAKDGTVQSMAISSGTVTSLLPGGPRIRGGTFAAEGELVAGQVEGGLLRQASGSWTPLTSASREASEEGHTWPHWIPGSDFVVFTVEYAAPKPSAIAVAPLASPASHVVVAEGKRAWFIDATHLVVARQDGLWTFRMQDRKAVDESRIAADVARAGNGTPIFAVGGGHLVYMPAASGDALIGASVEGAAGFRYLVQDRRPFSQPRISPDGQSVAVVERVDPQRFSLAVYDAAAGTQSTTVSIKAAASPRWTADSRWVVFPQAADGRWQLSWLSRTPGEGFGPVVTESVQGDRAGSNPVRLRTPGISAEWQISIPTAEGGCQQLVDTGGGQWPDARERPAPDASEIVLASGGRWLFFRQRSALLRREVLTGARLGSPMVVLADGLVDGPCGNPNYDVSPDGSRIVAVYRDPIVRPSSLRFVLNMAAELR